MRYGAELRLNGPSAEAGKAVRNGAEMVTTNCDMIVKIAKGLDDMER
jgi:hypothetical protein